MDAYVVMVAGTCQAGMEDYVRQHMSAIMHHSRTHAGCQLYNIHQAENDPKQFMMYSVWDNAAAFEAHNEQPEVSELKKKLAKSFFTEESGKTYWQLLE